MFRRVVEVFASLGLVLGLAHAQGEPGRVVGPVVGGPPEVIALRLRPGADLRVELSRLAQERGLQAAWVSTCVGSLTKVALHVPDRPEVALEGHFEIVALSGVVSSHGTHLHLAVADGDGRTVGGHLLDGSVVRTTAEVVLLSSPDLRFTRAKDAETTFAELTIERAR